MDKHITVIPAAGGAYRDLTLKPGTTCRDVKTELALGPEYVLKRGKDRESIPDEENMFETCVDGEKIFSSSDVEWGQE